MNADTLVLIDVRQRPVGSTLGRTPRCLLRGLLVEAGSLAGYLIIVVVTGHFILLSLLANGREDGPFLSLRLRFGPGLDDLDEATQPGVGLVAVDDAVVDGQRDIGHRADKDRVLARHGAHHHALFQLADAKDRGLSLVQDNRRGEQRARHAVVGNGEASAGNVAAFGPLPEGFPDDVLPVIFSFDPRVLR